LFVGTDIESKNGFKILTMNLKLLGKNRTFFCNNVINSVQTLML
jgi:hypothetical protein